LTGDEPIEQMADRGERLLDARCRELARNQTLVWFLLRYAGAPGLSSAEFPRPSRSIG
jgi:hypothetical protein